MTDRKQFKLQTMFSSNYKRLVRNVLLSFKSDRRAMKGKTLTAGERKIIINVFNYFKTENSLLKRNVLVEMTVKATGVSATSVKIIVEEDGTKSPCKNRPKRKKGFNRLDGFLPQGDPTHDIFILCRRRKLKISKTALEI